MDVISFFYTEFKEGFLGASSEFYKYIMETKSDPRTYDWLLIKSPIPLLTILAIYLYFCTKLGPNLMKDRKPFEMRHIMILYDVAQIILNTYTFTEHLKGGWGGSYSFACQPVDFSNSPSAMRMASSVWWYFIGNVIALLDTVFVVLRKKYIQISFLHLYHHSMMPLCSWIGAKYLPGGHGSLLGLINSFTHILMYSYYLLTSLGPGYLKYLRWKRHITELQMIQFFILFLHNSQALFRQCDYPKTMNSILLAHEFNLLLLLGRLYVLSYTLQLHYGKRKMTNTPTGKLKEQ